MVALVCAGASAIRRVQLSSATIGTAVSLSVGFSPTLTDVDFRDITAAGNSVPAGISWTGTRLGDCGGNTKISFDAAKTVYWNLTGTQNWSATGWATTSGDTPAVNNFPLAQDTAIFDNTGAATIVNIDGCFNIGTLDMSARTSALTFGPQADITVYGNWVTGSGITYTDTGTGNSFTTFAGTSAQTITCAGKTLTQGVEIYGVSLTLLDAFATSSNDQFYLYRGTFDANGYNVTQTAGYFATSGTITRTLALGSGTWTIDSSIALVEWNVVTATGLTVTGTGTISLTSASAKQFVGGSVNYSGITLNQGGAGTLTISGINTFANISNTYSATGATTITFAAAQTVLDFTATGEAGRVLTINSSSSGNARTLTKASGIVSVNYMSIRDSAATGGAAWYAGANSVNTSNNTGWIFTAPDQSSSNFFSIF